MLFSIDDTQTPITAVPHELTYRQWRDRLSPAQISSIKHEINARLEAGDVATAGWIPGSDWTGTVWQPIYEVACHQSVGASGMCFGLIVWETVMERDDDWSFGRYEANGMPIESLTYFRISR